MSQVSRLVTSFPYLPRSLVLKREAALDRQDATGAAKPGPTLESYTSRITSHESALQLYSELQSISSSDRARNKLNRLVQNLDSYASTVRNLRRGSLSSGLMSADDLEQISYLKPLVRKLLANTLREQLRIPESFKINQDGNVTTEFERYLEQLKEQKNWKELHFALKTGKDFFPMSVREPIQQETKSLEVFLNASFLEEMGQYARAIAAYRQIQGGTTTYVPAELAIERLAALESAHPKEAELATSMAESRYNRPSIYGYRSPYPRPLSNTQKELLRVEVLGILDELNASKKPKTKRAKKEPAESPATRAKK